MTTMRPATAAEQARIEQCALGVLAGMRAAAEVSGIPPTGVATLAMILLIRDAGAAAPADTAALLRAMADDVTAPSDASMQRVCAAGSALSKSLALAALPPLAPTPH